MGGSGRRPGPDHSLPVPDLSSGVCQCRRPGLAGRAPATSVPGGLTTVGHAGVRAGSHDQEHVSCCWRMVHDRTFPRGFLWGSGAVFLFWFLKNMKICLMRITWPLYVKSSNTGINPPPPPPKKIWSVYKWYGNKTNVCFQHYELSQPLVSKSSNPPVAMPTIPPHSLVAFGLFLRLPGYADVLLKERKKAQCLLRLVLGVTDDGDGGKHI